jgi:hypothetical protein
MTSTKNSRLVESAIKRIEERYAIGREILEQCGPTSPHGMIAQLADRYKINRDTAQKLRAMAGPETGYTKSQLEKWFKLFRSEGRSLSISHFIKLVSVPRGPQRDHLTREALSHGWSSHELQSEILALQGRRQEGGRRPKLASAEKFANQFRDRVWSWRRWLDLHLESMEELDPRLRREAKSLQRKLCDGMARIEDFYCSKDGINPGRSDFRPYLLGHIENDLFVPDAYPVDKGPLPHPLAAPEPYDQRIHKPTLRGSDFTAYSSLPNPEKYLRYDERISSPWTLDSPLAPELLSTSTRRPMSALVRCCCRRSRSSSCRSFSLSVSSRDSA